MKLDLSLNTKHSDYWHELEVFLTTPDLNKDEIQKAFLFAENAHKDQKRSSGEDYISHPVWVAKVVAQLGVGQKAVEAALLHDCVEDTPLTVDDIAKYFGDEVALLVHGLTDVKKKTKGVEIHQTSIEIFRKFLFSSVNDVRVLIIRLVDKLHNGLTLNSLSEERKIKYANRVFGIYGPVAEYVGLHYFKRKLEDIAFQILYPKEAKQLLDIFKEKENDEIKALALVRETIGEMMDVNHIKKYEVEGRIKSLYSSYLKMKKKGLERIKDRVGVRVITESVADCYSVLGLLHSKYNYLPDEFSDYISAPKPNGYRSIQTTLNWKDKLTVEVQIRTKQMHEFNEFGPASHIAYKLSSYGNVSKEGVGYEWVRDLIKWQKNDNNVNNYTINVLTKFVYIFTPKGDTIQMKAGSTALDFAYRIHTDVGNHCSGAKINGKMSKIDNVLKTGDLVEILTSKKLNVNKNWLDFVKTSWAKEQIKRMTQKS